MCLISAMSPTRHWPPPSSHRPQGQPSKRGMSIRRIAHQIGEVLMALAGRLFHLTRLRARPLVPGPVLHAVDEAGAGVEDLKARAARGGVRTQQTVDLFKIGRASCRERV